MHLTFKIFGIMLVPPVATLRIIVVHYDLNVDGLS